MTDYIWLTRDIVFIYSELIKNKYKFKLYYHD